MGTLSSNRQIIFISHPKGLPDESNFELRKVSIPKIKNEEVLVRTLYLSVDPLMRDRMNEPASYFPSFELGHPCNGGVVGKVIESNSSDFTAGDIVEGYLDWADYSVAYARNLKKIDPTVAPITTALGVLGMPGMSAYFGLLDIGQPKQGETVVVSAAAGAVGSLAGQIAKIKGCRVVGIVGSDEKKEYILKQLGFDAAINYKKPDLAAELKKACPSGVDVYFDNVGGDITDTVFPLLNYHARVVICGQISIYNRDKPDIGPRKFWMLLYKAALAKGFMVYDYLDRYPEGLQQMAKWIKEGKIKYRENIIEGLENAPRALIGLFKGENIGKQLVKVSD
jgi:NADPH:quinone reductase